MNAQCIETLVESDFIGFSNGKNIARIFSQSRGWYIGTCKNISFDKNNPDLCLIRLDLFMSFDRKLDVTDPQDPGEVIFTSTDKVKGALRINELPFRLFNPQRIIDSNLNSPILIIQGEEDGIRKIAIISKRLRDVAAIEEITEFAQFLSP